MDIYYNKDYDTNVDNMDVDDNNMDVDGTYGGNNPDISFYMDTMLNVKPNTKSMLIDRLIPSFNDLIKRSSYEYPHDMKPGGRAGSSKKYKPVYNKLIKDLYDAQYKGGEEDYILQVELSSI